MRSYIAISILKGLSYRSFKKHLQRVREDEPCIIHFRLATHGSIKRANCHPFNRGDVWFAHNGILNIQPMGDMTDSETALQKVIYPAIVKYGYGSEGMDVAVTKVIGYSKFAFMQGGDVRFMATLSPATMDATTQIYASCRL